ncbi:hypothetical protein [Mangrovivirga cuniculi]|uniref:Lipocalin-like domain-containing protein n=1 Tax=Mangrovivirga cuniculi TaxID=2715131 RepID=A0A4D7JLN9_9BACT|nr:hypothetical protein [Mangrovivirga cuniculi]QCK16769.1 hypothetical protein DCC35_19550 [Mangrovivirga cuniculi]
MKSFFNRLLILVFVFGFIACSEDESVTPLKETVWVETRWIAENCEDPQNNQIEETGCTEEYCFKMVFGEETVEMIETNSGTTTTDVLNYTNENGMISFDENDPIKFEIRGNTLVLLLSGETSPCDYSLELVAE